MNLKGRKILLVSVRFFDYERKIIEKLQELGAEVDFYDDRPSNSVLAKGIIRFKKQFYQHRIKKYYRWILSQVDGKNYTDFLLIKGEATPHFFLEELKRMQPKMRMIYYSYDSIIEYPFIKDLLPFFDEVFTFDRKDSFDEKMHFRPLFFIDEYEKDMSTDIAAKYDVVFIGSAHTDRFLIGEKIKKECDQLRLRAFFYYYSPSRAALWLKSIFDKTSKKFDDKKADFKPFSHDEILNYYQQCKCIVDINKPFQNGLTMRCFEVLASKRKLMTTNAEIKNYPFYHPQNIEVINRDHVKLNADFFDAPFLEIGNDIKEMMTLTSWIECLFGKHQDEYWLK